MFNEEKKTKSFIGGLITGGILGGLAGILFAPKSGKKLRRDISDKSNEIAEETAHLIETAKKKSSKIIYEAKEKTEDLLEDVKRKIYRISNSAENLITHSWDKIDESASKFNNAVKSGADTLINSGKKIYNKNFN